MTRGLFVLELVKVTGEPAAGVAVTVYPVIALPPFEAGGVNETDACESPGVTETITGA